MNRLIMNFTYVSELMIFTYVSILKSTHRVFFGVSLDTEVISMGSREPSCLYDVNVQMNPVEVVATLL